jgi:hypothetical protein
MIVVLGLYWVEISQEAELRLAPDLLHVKRAPKIRQHPLSSRCPCAVVTVEPGGEVEIVIDEWLGKWAITVDDAAWPRALGGIVALMESGRTDPCGVRSDGEGEFGGGRGDPIPRVDIHTEFVVVSAETSHVR